MTDVLDVRTRPLFKATQARLQALGSLAVVLDPWTVPRPTTTEYVYLQGDEAIELNTDERIPRGRVVIVTPDNPFGGPWDPRAGARKRVDALVRVDFGRFNSPPFDVENQIELAHAIIYRSLQDWLPADNIGGSVPATPWWREMPPPDQSGFDEPTQTYYRSSLYRIEVQPPAS